MDLDVFGRHIAELVATEMTALGHEGCQWRVTQEQYALSPVVHVETPSGWATFQIDYEEQAVASPADVSAQVRQHLRHAFGS